MEWHKFSELLPRIEAHLSFSSEDIIIDARGKYLVGHVCYATNVILKDVFDHYETLQTAIDNNWSWCYANNKQTDNNSRTCLGVRIDI